jgi:glycosyltransferase involved in cell wall biosynthesis
MKQTFTVTVEGFGAGADVAGQIKKLVSRNGLPLWRVSVEPQGEPVEDVNHGGPLVSILLPTYNYAHRIERMIASIRAQSVKDVELIVVDDGSADDTIAKVRPLLGTRDRLLIHGKNFGAAEAINTAARAASGRYMTWVSADNEMTTGWLEKLLGIMTPAVGVSYANYDRFSGAHYDPATQDPRTWGKPYDPTRLLNDENCYIGPAFLVRSEVWRAVGGMRGKINCDYDHWLRIEEDCLRRGLSFAYCSQVLCHYYAGNERATVALRHEYDAGIWQAEARKRRGVSEPATVS